MHDPSLYPDPFTFSPERFVDDPKAGKKAEPDPRQFAYGFGRRVCPGMRARLHLAVYQLTSIVFFRGAFCRDVDPSRHGRYFSTL